MSTREVILDGGSPWGFRMHGGADVGQPLRISRVNPGSKAAQKGVREGDVISTINGQSTRSITNSDAHALLRNAGQTLHLGLNEECSGSPKRRAYRNVQEVRTTESIKRANSLSSNSSTTTSTTVKTAVAVHPVGQTTSTTNGPLSGDSKQESSSHNGAVSKGSAASTSTPDGKGTGEASFTMRRVQSKPGAVTSESTSASRNSGPGKQSPRQSQPAGPAFSSTSSNSATTGATDVPGSASRARRHRRNRANRRRGRSSGSRPEEKTQVISSVSESFEKGLERTSESDSFVTCEGDLSHDRDGSNNLQYDTKVLQELSFASSETENMHESRSVDDSQGTNQEDLESNEVISESVVTETKHQRLTCGSMAATSITSSEREEMHEDALTEGTRDTKINTEQVTVKSIVTKSKQQKLVLSKVTATTMVERNKQDDVTNKRRTDCEVVKVKDTEVLTNTVAKLHNELKEKDIERKVIEADKYNTSRKDNIHREDKTMNSLRTIDTIDKFNDTKQFENETTNMKSVSSRNECEEEVEEVTHEIIEDKTEDVRVKTDIGTEGRDVISDQLGVTVANNSKSEFEEVHVLQVNKKIVQEDMKEQSREECSNYEDENVLNMGCIVDTVDQNIVDGKRVKQSYVEPEVEVHNVSNTQGKGIEHLKQRNNINVNFVNGVHEVIQDENQTVKCKVRIVDVSGKIGSENSQDNTGNLSQRKSEEEDSNSCVDAAAEIQNTIGLESVTGTKVFEDQRESEFEETVVITELRSRSVYTTYAEACNTTNNQCIPPAACDTSVDNTSCTVAEQTADALPIESSVNSKESYNKGVIATSAEQPRLTLHEHTAVVLEVDDNDGAWERVGDLQVSGYDSGTDETAQTENWNMEHTPDIPCILTSNTTALHQDAETSDEDDTKLSMEDEELLEPIPAMLADEEQSLRLYLQTLNLAESPEIPHLGRSVSLEEPFAVEEVPLRRGKKRAHPEVQFAPYQRQRFLDVIQEETSDISDSERKLEESGSNDQVNSKVKESGGWIRAWEDAIYNPETNEVIIITRTDHEAVDEENRNDTDANEFLTYEECLEEGTEMEIDIPKSPENVLEESCLESEDGIPREEVTGRVLKDTVIISETSTVNVESFQRVHEKAWLKGKEHLWRPSVIISEADSAAASGDESGGEQRVDLAESSDDCEREGPWNKRAARSSQSAVEIVSLDDDNSIPTTVQDVTWKKDMTNQKQSGVEIVFIEDDNSIPTTVQDVTWKKGIANERESAVEVVFIENDNKNSVPSLKKNVKWKKGITQKKQSDVEVVFLEEDRSANNSSVATVQEDVTWKRDIATERQSGVEVVFLEDDSTSESSVPATQDEAEDADAEEEPEVEDGELKSRVSPKLKRVSPHKIDKQQSREIVKEKSPSKLMRLSPLYTEEETSIVTTSLKVLIGTSTESVESKSGKEGTAIPSKLVSSERRETKGRNSEILNKEDVQHISSNCENSNQEYTQRMHADFSDKTLIVTPKCERVIIHQIEDNILDKSSILRITKDNTSVTSSVETNTNEKMLSENTNKCFKSEVKTVSSTGVLMSLPGKTDNVLPNRSIVPLVKENNVVNGNCNSVLHGTGNGNKTICRNDMGMAGTRVNKPVTQKNGASPGDKSGTHSGATVTTQAINNSKVSSNNMSVTNINTSTTDITQSTYVTKTNCNVNFCHGTAFCYIDLPTQSAGRFSSSENKNETSEFNKVSDNNPVNDKPAIDQNNFEFIKRLLAIMPHQELNDRNIYSLLSQLTIAQISMLSPSLKQNIDALLTLSGENCSTDAQTPPPNNKTGAEVTAENGSGIFQKNGGGLDDDLTPPSYSRPGSTSSDATSHNTALYNPSLSRASSEADVSASCDDPDCAATSRVLLPGMHRASPRTEIRTPKTLKELSVKAVVALPCGIYILHELGLQLFENFNIQKPSHVACSNIPPPPERKSHVNILDFIKRPQSPDLRPASRDDSIIRPLFIGYLPDLTCIDDSTREKFIYQAHPSAESPAPPPVPTQYPAQYEPSPPAMASPAQSPLPPPVPPPPPEDIPSADWMGLPTLADPRLLVCLSPAQRRSYDSGYLPTVEDPGRLLDLHCKFLGRRSYHEQSPLYQSHTLYPRHPSSIASNSGENTPRHVTSLSPVDGLSADRNVLIENKVHLSPRAHQRLNQQISPAVNKVSPIIYKHQQNSPTDKPNRKVFPSPNQNRQLSPASNENPRITPRSNQNEQISPASNQSQNKSPTSNEERNNQDKHSSSPKLQHTPPSTGSTSPSHGPMGTGLTSPDAKIPACSSKQAEIETASRLLAILREASPAGDQRRAESCPPPSRQNMLKFVREYQHQQHEEKTVGSRPSSWYAGDDNKQARLKVQLLSEWIHLARTPTPPISPVASAQPDPETRVYKVNSSSQDKNTSRNDILERTHSLHNKTTDEDEKFRLLTEQLSTVAREIEEKERKKLQKQKRLSLPQKLSEKIEQQLQSALQNRPPVSQQKHWLDTQHASSQEEENKQQEYRRQQWLFDADKYIISKKGDIAVIQSDLKTEPTRGQERPKLQRPKSMTDAVVTDGELFRQQMYLEYMNKVAERAERRRQKVIRISTRPEDNIHQSYAVSESMVKSISMSSLDTVDTSKVPVYQLECEFMGRVRERMDKLGLKYDDEDEDYNCNADVPDSEVKVAPDVTAATTAAPATAEADGRYVIQSGGGSVRQLPKHLQEFLVLTAESDTDGVWTPSQKAGSGGKSEESNASRSQQQEQQRKDEDATTVIWTPRSAGASPTAERKEFRPVSFDSPTLARKNRSPAPAASKPEDSKASSTPSTPPQSVGESPSVLPPWQREDGVTTVSSSTSSRLVQSQSAPASGLSVLASGGTNSTSKLPRAQNPTITLLQKAREGQLPRGALYLDHRMSSKDNDKPVLGQNDILYTVKGEYQKEAEGGQQKKVMELGPRKFEGIGPTTKEGIPLVLRSEVKDVNQAKWYKRMYDSLHRAGKDDDYITIRYKPRRGHYPYTYAGGYLSEPEHTGYDSDIGYSAKYATLDRRRIKNKENDFTTSTLPRSKYVPHPSSIKYATDVYKNQPGRIEDYEPGHSSISDKEAKQWWDEVLDIFDGASTTNQQTTPSTPSNKPFMTYALKESGYESDSTLVFKRRDENIQNQLSPAEQKIAYKTIQKGGEVPLHGLRKPAPERPKESPHRYVESEVTIHYRSPVRAEAKEALSEEELALRQAEAMRRIYQEERRRKYLHELQDMHSRRHTDNFTPSQKSPIPLNRYDDFLDDISTKSKPRNRTPEPKLVARALYNFVGQTSRELSFRRGDIIFVRRQIDKNWYEGEHNAMVGLFPFNYVEIIPYDGIRTIPKRPTEGQARAKFNFIAQTHLELSLVKGELVVLTRRVDDNWFEGRIGTRKGIFPVSYVEVLSEPGERAVTPGTPTSKPVASPASHSHSLLVNGSAVKQHSYLSQQAPTSGYYSQSKLGSSYSSSNPYATLPRHGQTSKPSLAPMNQTLHIDTHSEPVPYRALYNYRPQNEDELELCEGDTVYVMEKCDDGWYVGSSQRTGYFGTFPGNYVERL